MAKTAILFPGVGYHTDKPLLYYGKMLAREMGYRVLEVNYGGFAAGMKGDAQKMLAAFESAMQQTEEILAKEDFPSRMGDLLENELLVISKSIGTAVAAAWQKKHDLQAKNIYFTPVEASFQFIRPQSGIVFHGTGDSWVETSVVKENCEKLGLPLYVTQQANHSMEIGGTIENLEIMNGIMTQCRELMSVCRKV